MHIGGGGAEIALAGRHKPSRSLWAESNIILRRSNEKVLEINTPKNRLKIVHAQRKPKFPSSF